jgi:hypothetical protein
MRQRLAYVLMALLIVNITFLGSSRLNEFEAQAPKKVQ